MAKKIEPCVFSSRIPSDAASVVDNPWQLAESSATMKRRYRRLVRWFFQLNRIILLLMVMGNKSKFVCIAFDDRFKTAIHIDGYIDPRCYAHRDNALFNYIYNWIGYINIFTNEFSRGTDWHNFRFATTNFSGGYQHQFTLCNTQIYQNSQRY